MRNPLFRQQAMATSPYDYVTAPMRAALRRLEDEEAQAATAKEDISPPVLEEEKKPSKLLLL